MRNWPFTASLHAFSQEALNKPCVNTKQNKKLWVWKVAGIQGMPHPCKFYVHHIALQVQVKQWYFVPFCWEYKDIPIYATRHLSLAKLSENLLLPVGRKVQLRWERFREFQKWKIKAIYTRGFACNPVYIARRTSNPNSNNPVDITSSATFRVCIKKKQRCCVCKGKDPILPFSWF